MRRAPCPKPRRCHVAAACLLATSPAAWSQPEPTHTGTVVISGSGTERRAFETPYAVSVVDAAELRSAGPMVNLSESLSRVPGLVANLRNNYAQDLQLSSRGFGARATFGIRGLRLYTDGIPATMPDGQGQVSHFDIAGAQRIEVLRGPFSALYGANSGGVISLVSAAPRSGNAYSLDGDVGSDGLWQARAGRRGAAGRRLEHPCAWPASSTPTACARTVRHSARWATCAWAGSATRTALTLLLNSVDQPAQDPLGLTRAQFDADPYQTTAAGHLFDTRKTTGQTQGGATWRHRFADAGALERERAHRLRRAARRDAVAGHPAGHAGQSAPPRRRDRLRTATIPGSTRGWSGAGTMPR